jgi:hypothetical protein
MKIRGRTAAAVVSTAVAVLIAAGPGAAVAAAPASGKWKATKIESGYDLKFKVEKGKVTKIVGHVLEYCGGSSTSSTTTFAPDSSWKIKGNKFSGRHKEKHGKVTAYFTFEGTFTSKTKAKGVLREESVVAGTVCDTYELDWKAKKG